MTISIIHVTREELAQVVEQLLALPTEQAREVLGVGSDGRDWKLASAVASVREREMWSVGERVDEILYRPFDVRYTVMNSKSGGFLAYPRWEVMRHLVRVTAIAPWLRPGSTPARVFGMHAWFQDTPLVRRQEIARIAARFFLYSSSMKTPEGSGATGLRIFSPSLVGELKDVLDLVPTSSRR